MPSHFVSTNETSENVSSDIVGSQPEQCMPGIKSPNIEGLTKSLDSAPTSANNANSWRFLPAFLPSTVKPLEPPLSISVRFRHGALIRGYQMLTTHEASYSMICRTFRYNIFSNARETLIDRLHLLLNQSMATLPHLTSSSGDSLSYTSLNQENPVETLVPFSNIVYRLPEKAAQSDPTPPGGAKAITEESPEEYLYPDGVEDYLAERGLEVQPGSDVVLFPAPNSATHTSNPTLFDEIRAQKQLRLSVSKLLGGE